MPSIVNPRGSYLAWICCRSGISCRQGPHQVAQKLIMTTWPLSSLRRTSPPSRAGSAKSGAGGAGPVAVALPASSASSRVGIRVRASRMWCSGFSEECGQPEAELEVLRQLLRAKQIALEHLVTYAEVRGERVGHQQPQARAGNQREVVIAGEARAAGAERHIDGARHGTSPAQEHLARQHVPADREVVVGELALAVGQQFERAAEVLVARAPGLGSADSRLGEEILGEVIRGTRPVGHAAPEVLDRDRADKGAGLEVLRVDPRRFDGTPVDLRHDDLRSLASFADRCLRQGARRTDSAAERSGAQKKYVKPMVHSSISSLSSRLVRTTNFRYSACSRKRSVR